MNRVGLINFWYYDEQYYQFADGKMLLRGSNGSGKSVTMQSLMPVLLDGRLGASRLDSFGSTARKMEDYLLGEEEVTKLQERTGYLVAEYKRVNSDEYLTTGIGMQARRGDNMTSWFFAIQNNERVGVDFSLFEAQTKEEMQPLSKRQLITRLENKGMVFKNRKGYQQFINERLFGFPSLVEFDELIKLMIQLRSPKLSKEFKPSVIYEILTNALPALSEDALQPLSQTLESLESSRSRLDQFEREKQALKTVTKSYEKMYQEKLRQIAQNWLEKRKKLLTEEKQLAEHTKEYQSCDELLSSLQTEDETLEIQMDSWREEHGELQHHEAFQLINQGEEVKRKISEIESKKDRLKQQIKQKETSVFSLKREIETLEMKSEAYQKEVEELFAEMSDHSQAASFEEKHRWSVAHYQQEQQMTTLDYLREEMKRQKQHLQEVYQLLQQRDIAIKNQREKDNQLGALSAERDEHRKQERHWQTVFSEEKQQLHDDLFAWHRGLSFQLDSSVLGTVLARLDDVYENYKRFEQVLQPIYDESQEVQQEYNNQLFPIRGENASFQQQIQAIEAEIQEWKFKKEPEPERLPETEAYRQQLKAENIMVVPFYSCVDFLPNVSENKRNQIESGLLVSGLLDALVSPEALELCSDQQILPNPQLFEETLADYLEPSCEESGFSDSYIMEILQTIAVKETAGKADIPVIGTDGSYQLSILRGQGISEYESSYIGKASRERLKLIKINQLENEKSEILSHIAANEAKEAKLREQIERLKVDLTKLPKDTNLSTAYDEMKSEQRMIEDLTEKYGRIESELITLKQVLDQLKLTIAEKGASDSLEKKVEAYQQALKSLEDYQEAFANLREVLKDLENTTANLKDKGIYLGYQEEELVGMLQEREELDSDYRRLELQLESILERQKLTDIEDIKRRVEQVNRQLKNGKLRKKAMTGEKEALAEKRTTYQISIQQLTDSVTFLRPFTSTWETLFIEEYKRFQLVDEENWTAVAKQLLLEWKFKESELERLENRLAQTHKEKELDLLEYRPKIEGVKTLEAPTWFEPFLETHTADIQLWYQMNNQKVIQVDSEGAWRSIYDLEASIQSQVEELDLLIQKKDEELFEEIIFNSVGSVIRQLIEKAQKWANNMNQIFKEQKNSSSLSLSIKWQPKKAANEGELSTAELVTLLRKPRELLKESDSQSIKQHFQEKIARAKFLRDASDGEASLYQVLQQVLDYRSWFEFELYYSKENEGKKALTDTNFFKFSGGEKAICMYLPLFISIYSRYQDVRKDAPYIITLDEAFAGIDELNISELFKATEQLGFNYMINSQSLYGEYASVSSLNTYELIRPKNAPVVSTLLYHWDGKEKRRIIE